MPLPAERRFAGVLATNQGRVILVQEEHPHWGGKFWNIPSGRVEDHETPAEGAARELAEEAGVEVLPGRLRLLSTSSVRIDDQVVLAWNFHVAVDDVRLAPDDPDRLVRQAEWFPMDAATRLLSELPYRPIAEPMLAALSDRDRPLAHWSYAAPDAAPEITDPAGWAGAGSLRSRHRR